MMEGRGDPAWSNGSPYRAVICAFRLPSFAFKGSKCPFDDFSERHPMHDLAAFVALALSLDDLVEAVVRTLRDPSVEENCPA
jgi:hypothetical protein